VQAVLDQVDALNDQIAQLAIQRAKIASADLSPGAVTAPARAPVPSSHDAAAIYLIGALLGGALLGMIVAHAREAFDRRVRSVEQAADLSGLPSLGVVRSARGGGVAGADARYVALAVRRWVDQRPDRPLVVLSNRADEGRTPVAGNLAVAMAEAGLDVHLAAPPATTEELRQILLVAQRRTPPTSPAPATSRADAPYAVGGGAARQLTNGASAAGLMSAGSGPMSLMPAVRGTSGTAGSPVQVVSRAHDPDATLVMSLAPAPPVTPGNPVPGPAGIGPATGDGSSQVVPIGSGSVRLVAFGDHPAAGPVVVDAPPADVDERGVRAAQSGTAVLVVACDRTRNAELTRLVERLRSADVGAAGFVLTGGRRA
jgi:Mrp family chromosome partitioning ATPase